MFTDPLGLFAHGSDEQQHSTINSEAEQSLSNVSNFVNGVVTGFNNSFNALNNLDFGMDCGQNAWNSFSNGDILGGIAWELNGMTEVVLDFGAALIGAGVLGAGISSAGTLITTGSTTSAYVSWQYNLQNNLGIVNSNIQSGWNQFCSNTGISNLINKVKTISFNIKYFHSDGSPRWPKRDGFKGKVIDVTLEPGTIIDRYGYDTGSFVSPYGTSYTQRALPPGTNLKPYSVFEVVKPLNVKSGEVKPWFGEEGHGIQYMFNQPIYKLLENGTLRRIEY